MNCNNEQNKFIEFIEKNIINNNIKNLDPIFITGAAGCGKSYLLRYAINKFKEYNITPNVTSFTAMVSRMIGGKTIHSLFGFDYYAKCVNPNIRVIKNMKVLVIDEISMVSAKYLDSINDVLKKYKNSNEIFGGVFVITFGDLYQLEPISNEENVELPVFKSDLWKFFKKYQLHENMRQNEIEFINALNTIRIGKADNIKYFNDIYEKTKSIDLKKIEIFSTTIVSTNNEADIINTRIFNKIKKDNPTYYLDNTEYESKYIDYDPETYDYSYNVNDLYKILPTMHICKNTKIMITTNYLENSYKNGDIFYINDFKIDKNGKIEYIILNDIDGNKNILYKNNAKFRTKRKDKILSISGFTITYAWAITCHKSQGSTIDNLIIKSNNIFAKGQLYVALSRVKSSSGLMILNKITEKYILHNDEVDKLYINMENLNI